MSLSKKRNRNLRSLPRQRQKIDIQVVTKKNIAEFWMSLIGAIGSAVLAIVAVYAAFFSPLSDALQAQYKYKDLTNKEEIEVLNKDLSRKASQLKDSLAELLAARNKLNIERSNLREIESKILSSSSQLQLNEKLLTSNEVKISEMEFEYERLIVLLSEKQDQFEDLDKLYTDLLVQTSKRKLGEVVRNGHLFLGVNMLRKYSGEDEYMRDRPKLDVSKISSFDGKYLWENAKRKLEDTNVTESEIETYGPKFEQIFDKLKSQFIVSCESSFLSIQYIEVAKFPIFEDLKETNSNVENVQISMARVKKRTDYMNELLSEVTAYQERVRTQTFACMKNMNF